MIPRRKEPMANVLREHRMIVAHMADVASGRVAARDEDDDEDTDEFTNPPPRRGSAPEKSDEVSSSQTALEEPGLTPGHPGHTYSIVTDDRQSGFFDPGYGVRDDLVGVLMNEEPLSMRRAERLLEALEDGIEL